MLAALAAGLAAWAASSDLPAPVEAVCGELAAGSFERTRCVEQYYAVRVTHDRTAALDEIQLRWLANDDYVGSWCHEVLHAAGIAARQRVGDTPDRLFDQAALFCAGGYAHGFVDSRGGQEDQPADRQDLIDYRDACVAVTEPGSRSFHEDCAHGTGHLVVETLDHQDGADRWLADGRAVCNELFADASSWCLQGVLMDWASWHRDTYAAGAIPTSGGEPIVEIDQLCDQLDGADRTGCLRILGDLNAFFNGDADTAHGWGPCPGFGACPTVQPATLAQRCAAMEDDADQLACAAGVGHDRTLQYGVTDPDVICPGTGSQRHELACQQAAQLPLSTPVVLRDCVDDDPLCAQVQAELRSRLREADRQRQRAGLGSLAELTDNCAATLPVPAAVCAQAAAVTNELAASRPAG